VFEPPGPCQHQYRGEQKKKDSRWLRKSPQLFVGCGIEGPHPIEGRAGPGQCRPRKRSHGGTKEQENADGNHSARYLVSSNFFGVRVATVSHQLTILNSKTQKSWPSALASRAPPDWRTFVLWFIASGGTSVSTSWRAGRKVIIQLLVERLTYPRWNLESSSVADEFDDVSCSVQDSATVGTVLEMRRHGVAESGIHSVIKIV